MRRHLSTIRPANQWTYPCCLGRVFLSFEAEATTIHHQPRRNVSNKPFCMHTTSKQAMPFLHRLLQPQRFTATISYTMRVSIGNKRSVQSTTQQGSGSSPTEPRECGPKTQALWMQRQICYQVPTADSNREWMSGMEAQKGRDKG